RALHIALRANRLTKIRSLEAAIRQGKFRQAKSSAAMRSEEVDRGASRYDPGRIDSLVTAEVVAFDVAEIYRRFDLVLLIQVTRVWPQVGVIDDAPQIGLEVAVVDGIKTHQRREKTPVGLGDRVAGEVTAVSQAVVQPVQRLEEREDGFLVGVLGRSKAAAVHPVVQGRVAALLDLVEFIAQRAWIKARRADAVELVERAVQHADDFGSVAIDDRAGLSVPQDRYRPPTRVSRIRCDVYV